MTRWPDIWADDPWWSYPAFLSPLVPVAPVAVRRRPDVGRTGAWLPVTPTGLGCVAVLVMPARPGEDGPNRYGGTERR